MPAIARHAARREPAAAPRARLRAGARRRPDHGRRSRDSALKLLEVDEHGFDEVDRRLLRTIIDKFGGGPVGVASLAAAMSEERDAIEEIYEPFLIQIGFLDRTPRGRVATPRAYEYFGLSGSCKGSFVVDAGDAATRQDRRPLDLRPAEGLLTNADLEKLVDTSDEWILQRTGIRERHIVDPGVATSDLAEGGGARGHARRPGVTPDDIGFIVVGTTTPDTIFPSTACVLQNKIGARQRLGLRSRRRLFGIHLCADDRHADGRDRRARSRARRRR